MIVRRGGVDVMSGGIMSSEFQVCIYLLSSILFDPISPGETITEGNLIIRTRKSGEVLVSWDGL